MSVPWYLMAKGKGGGGYKTASGPIVSVNDALAAPLRSLVVNIDPVQDLHGYENPWPAGGGKNLIYKTLKNVNINPDGAIAVYNPYDIFFAKVESGKTYTVSIDGVATRSVNAGYFAEDPVIGSITYDGTRNLDLQPTFEATYTGYIGLRFPTDTDNVQLEEGSTATTWSPYSNICPISGWNAVNVWVKPAYDPTANPTATIQLGQTIYGGTLDVTNGVLTVDMAMVDLGTLTWGFDGQATHRFIAYNQLDAKPSGSYSIAVPCVCSSYPTRTQNQTASGIMGISIQAISGKSAFIYDESYSDVTTFQSAMSGIKLVYPLATPITIPLTPQEISTLQGQNNVWTDSGDVTVEYLSSGGTDPDLMKLAVAFMGRK